MSSIVMDSFDIKGATAARYGATGVVVVFALGDAPEPRKGGSVVLVRPDGWFRIVRVGEVKEHGGKGRSFFLEALTRDDVPVGTRLDWEGARATLDDLQLALQADAK